MVNSGWREINFRSWFPLPRDKFLMMMIGEKWNTWYSMHQDWIYLSNNVTIDSSKHVNRPMNSLCTFLILNALDTIIWLMNWQLFKKRMVRDWCYEPQKVSMSRDDQTSCWKWKPLKMMKLQCWLMKKALDVVKECWELWK